MTSRKIKSAEVTRIDFDISISNKGITQGILYKTYLVDSRGMLSEYEIYPSKEELVEDMH